MNFRLETALGVSPVFFISAFSAISGLPPLTCQQSFCGWSQRWFDNCDLERAELELVSVSQPWLNIIYLLQDLLGVFSRGMRIPTQYPWAGLFGASAACQSWLLHRNRPVDVPALK